MSNFGNIIANKYSIQYKLGNGAFSTTYVGTHARTGTKVAIKIEYPPNKLVKHEAMILEYLQSNKYSRNTYIPQVFWYGKQEICNIMVTTFVSGLSLQTYIRNKTDFSKHILVELFNQTCSILAFIHSKQIIHRDVKPEHIIVDNNKCWLIDFGLASNIIEDDYVMIKSNEVEQDQVNNTNNTNESNLVGSLNYISHRIHCGNRPGAIDDYVSLCYVILECVLHTLPWKNNEPINNANYYSSIKEKKEWSSLSKNIPEKCLFINTYLSK